MPIGKANHLLFYLFMRTLNFPALDKIRSYSVTFVRERLQLLRWFFTWTTHLFSGKKLSLPREEPQVIFAIPAKEHFAGACAIWLFASSVNCDLGGQWAMDRFDE